jgi:hypothetical protein
VSTADPREHERIEELLAGYALRSLSGEDAAETDRLLATHVPSCLTCRRTLLELTATVAELAFAAPPVEPPETLLPRLHRQLEPRGRRRPGRWTGAAAGIAVAVVALGIAFSQGLQLEDLEERSARMNEVLQYLQHPGVQTDRLVPSDDGGGQMSEVAAPDVGFFYLLAEDVPPPPAGAAYGVWLSDGGATDAVFVGTLPWGPGLRVVKVPFDRSGFDRIVVTLEDAGAVPPSPGPPVWEAAA